MSVERWIVVRNWERFQHRDAARSSVPPWIKLHTQLLSDEAYLELSVGRRAMLVGIWLEYARTRRRLPDDTATLTRRLAQRVLRADLEALNDAGFIGFSASNDAGRLAGLEKSREENPLPHAARGDDEDDEELLECERCGKPVRARSTCGYCGATPRQAGTNPRALAKPNAYERAEQFTRNVGWEYDRVAFFEELERFKLSDEQRDQLDTLRAGLNGATANAIENPFIDDDE